MTNIPNISKSDFPIFSNYYKEHKQPLCFLDNASTTQKPTILMVALSEYYSIYNSNIGRGQYHLSLKSEEIYHKSIETISAFLNCDKNNIVFTNGATDSSNQIFQYLKSLIKPNTCFISSIHVHHSLLLPLQRLAKNLNCTIVYLENIPSYDEYQNLTDFFQNESFLKFFNQCSLVALSHSCNVSGLKKDLLKWTKLIKNTNIKFVVDGSQGIVHQQDELKLILPFVDFYFFSTHKIYGPMGLGILYMNSKLQYIEPINLGGGIVSEVSDDEYSLLSFKDDINPFQAGTPNIANIYAFAQTLKWLEYNEYNHFLNKEHLLFIYFLNHIKDIEGIKFTHDYFNTPLENFSPIISFYFEDIHSHDLNTYLNKQHICVRGGKHCAHLIFNHKSIQSSLRASLAIYNTKDDIDFFIYQLKKAVLYFRKFKSYEL